VPGIADWPGPSLGFTFACWLRLDPSDSQLSSSCGGVAAPRRQLYSLYSGSGSGGLEAFVLAGGQLAVATAVKKEFLVTRVEEPIIADGRWHFVAVCQVRQLACL
jgi:hypothetical protein